MKTLREYLTWAGEKQVAIGHFNISDSEGFKAVAETAKELGVPVIIGVSEGEREFIGLKQINALVKIARADGQAVFINADHTYSAEKAKLAIDAGVDSVIVDGAEKTFQENVRLTKEVVGYAHSRNSSADNRILIEGELGFIGKSSKLLEDIPDGVSSETQTLPEEAAEFVEATGVDLLAPSVGNIHGMVKTGNPKLNVERIRAIREAVGVPLVLHGGSGIHDEDLLEAIRAGVRIIHINTELRVAYKEGIEEGLKSDEIAPYKFLAEGVAEMKKVVKKRLLLFNGL